MLVSAVIDNMGLSNREELMSQLEASMQPNPEAQQAEQQAQQQQMEQQAQMAQAQLELIQAQTMEAQARAQKYAVEAQLEPEVVKAKLAAALSTNLQEGSADDSEFAKRAKIADLMLKEKDIQSNERIATMQMQNKNRQP